MDRNSWSARTDVIIIINPILKKITWIPRDIYIKLINTRINCAFSKGQHELLIKCLKEININVKYSLCLLPDIIELFLNEINEIKINIPITREYYYPLNRLDEIEKGKKIISFNYPCEILSGERLHQWIGARYAVKPYGIIGTDLDRINRQQVLIKEILKNNLKFNINNLNKNNSSGLNDNIINIIKTINNTWMTVSYLENIEFKFKNINNEKVILLIFKN